MRAALHRLSAAANAAALVFVVLVLANGAALFDGERDDRAPPRPLPAAIGAADRAVLVVIDGLRAKTAFDPGVMPYLCDLARRGGSGTAEVESLVPSTIAGITTLATGRVPPPASFVEDFRARPSPDGGGLFAAAGAAGGRPYVAGPRLWVDRFGPWLDASDAEPTFGGDDERVLAAALRALARRPVHRLVVVHFERTDDAAHRHGGASAEYADAARWCDGAVRRVAAALGPGSCVLVTSDHGVTDAGGHAGREPAVVRTPLVVFGPGLPAGAIPALRQRDLPRLLAAALRLELPPWSSAGAVPARTSRRAWALVAVVLAVASATRVWAALAAGATGRPDAFFLNAAVWVSLALAAAGWRAGAIGLAVATLVACATRTRRPPMFPVLAAVCAGGAVGALRMGVDQFAPGSRILFAAAVAVALVLGGSWYGRGAVDAAARRRRSGAASAVGLLVACACGHWLGGIQLTIVTAAAGAMAWLSGRGLTQRGDRRSARAEGASSAGWVFIGGLTYAAPILLAARAGRGLSLSSVDVRAAFPFASVVWGVPVAAAVILAGQTWPLVVVVAGCGAAVRDWPAGRRAGLAVGMVAVPVGSAVVAGLVLWTAPDDLNRSSLALACLVRAAAEAFAGVVTLVVVTVAAGAAERVGALAFDPDRASCDRRGVGARARNPLPDGRGPPDAIAPARPPPRPD